MRVTTKGQVTIPQHIREKLAITPGSEVDFISENGRVYIVKAKRDRLNKNRFQRLRGIATVQMTTDEIMQLTRSDA